MNWYYSVNDAQTGPVPQAEFDALVRSGVITADTLVWQNGMPGWVRYADLQASSVAVATGEGHRCVECGKTFPESEMIAFENAWVCAGCKPVFVQKLREGIAPRGELRYAGFWIRFAAYFIDGIILQIINYCIRLMIMLPAGGRTASVRASGVVTLVGLVVGITYFTYFVGRFSATPGKMALKLKIVRPNGEPMTYMRALGRYFGEILSGLIVGFGFMMAGWDPEKRALHDRICDTRVVHQP